MHNIGATTAATTTKAAAKASQSLRESRPQSHQLPAAGTSLPKRKGPADDSAPRGLGIGDYTP
jgi:hypothetical protein